MTKSELNLSNSPIVEAVLDIECDLPPGLQIAALEEHALTYFGTPTQSSGLSSFNNIR